MKTEYETGSNWPVFVDGNKMLWAADADLLSFRSQTFVTLRASCFRLSRCSQAGWRRYVSNWWNSPQAATVQCYCDSAFTMGHIMSIISDPMSFCSTPWQKTSWTNSNDESNSRKLSVKLYACALSYPVTEVLAFSVFGPTGWPLGSDASGGRGRHIIIFMSKIYVKIILPMLTLAYMSYTQWI